MICLPLCPPELMGNGRGTHRPSTTEQHTVCCHSHRKRGEFEAAVTDYTTAIRLNPQHCRAYYNRAFSYDRCHPPPTCTRVAAVSLWSHVVASCPLHTAPDDVCATAVAPLSDSPTSLCPSAPTAGLSTPNSILTRTGGCGRVPQYATVR
jgi:hypothetical protein